MKNDKILIQKTTETRSAGGGTNNTWSTVYTAYAKVDQVSGNENLNSDMIVYGDIKRFTIYYTIGQNVTAKMKIVYRSEDYDITSISHENRLQTIILAIRHDDE
jgi:SPP1 family predicted phage head-tail adaptor